MLPVQQHSVDLDVVQLAVEPSRGHLPQNQIPWLEHLAVFFEIVR